MSCPRRLAWIAVNKVAFGIETKLACHRLDVIDFGKDASKPPCIAQPFNVSFCPFEYARHEETLAHQSNGRNGWKAAIRETCCPRNKLTLDRFAVSIQ